jgi:hypothetical protein
MKLSLKVLAASATVAVAGLVGMSAPAIADNGDVTCNGTAPATVSHDLIVPSNTSCIILFGSQIKHDVIVQSGATLDDRGATIGHDLTASQPEAIHVNGGGQQGPGSVGHDVVIDGVSDSGLGSDRNSVCNNTIGHDLVVKNSAASADPWSIGDRNGVCGAGAVTVGHDMVIDNNANAIEVEDNSAAFGGNIGHDLTMTNNSGGLVAEANNAGHDCTQSNNHPYSNTDGDNDGLNTAGHSVDSCNTPNP